MSQFIDKLLMTDSNKRHVQGFLPQMSFLIEEHPDPRSPISFMKEYHMEVTYHRTIRCYEEHSDKVLELGKRELARLMYKEFEKELIEMNIALYEEDGQKMSTHMENLFNLIRC